MKPFANRFVSVLLAGGMLLGLSGCSRIPTEKDVYETACAAMVEANLIGSTSECPAIDKCRLYLGKNAARVDLPSSTGSHTVYLKRVARTWVVQDHEPTPGVTQ